MDKKQICKICNKSFANGKAMGGHIRSHLVKLPLSHKPNPPPTQKQKQPLVSNNPYRLKLSSSPSSSSSINYTSRENNPLPSSYHKSSPSVYRANISNAIRASVDVESDSTESLINPSRKRSKRRPKSEEKVMTKSILLKATELPDGVSSSVLSGCFNEKDAASCLLMLSSLVDEKKRKGKREEVDHPNFNHEDDDEDGDEELLGEEDSDEAEDESYYTRPKSSKSRQGKYVCEICNKVFRSYQALGGHKASHKKTKTIEEETYQNKNSANGDNSVGGSMNKRIFNCCFCDKVFESGQALGGHKKVHFPYLGSKPLPKSSVACEVRDLIDLNLPPPEALEDECGKVKMSD